jgi:serine/threonine protein phosphatase PrpC
MTAVPPNSGRTWRGIGLTDRGRVRLSNQDTFAVLDEDRLWLVADGMGGQAGGDVASRLAVESIRTSFQESARSWNAPTLDQVERSFRRAIHKANQAIRQAAARQPRLTGMGTTVVALTLTDHPTPLVAVAHVGDSRAYLLRDQQLHRLTWDHSFVENSIREGLLSPQEALTHPYRHVLSRALGTELEVEPDWSSRALDPADLFLLCSDGLTKMLTDAQILETLLRHGSAEAACRALIHEALRRGGEDNVTAIVIRNELTNE